jgi:hypothetical protein
MSFLLASEASEAQIPIILILVNLHRLLWPIGHRLDPAIGSLAV